METTKPANNKRKAVLIGIGIAATGIAGYFGWQYLQRRKQEQPSEDTDFYVDNTPTPSTPQTGTRTTPPRASDNFPLKKGSRGPNVKALQEALIAGYGASILPKYGADGDFGSETEAALKKLNLPASVDQSTLNILAAGSAPDAEKLAAELYQAASTKNFNGAIASLSKIRSTQEYSAVSSIFQEKYRIGLVRKTLVNAMLDTFTEETQKQQIRLSFSRMGLVYDGSKWSLSGLGGFSLITTQPTKVWVDAQTPINVPGMLVLGPEVERRGSYCAFENSGRTFLVPIAHVRYL